MADDFAVTKDGLIVVEQGQRVVQLELQHAALDPLVPLPQHRFSADEGFLVGSNCESKPGLQHMVFACDVMAEMPECFFGATAVHHMHSAQFKA